MTTLLGLRARRSTSSMEIWSTLLYTWKYHKEYEGNKETPQKCTQAKKKRKTGKVEQICQKLVAPNIVIFLFSLHKLVFFYGLKIFRKTSLDLDWSFQTVKILEVRSFETTHIMSTDIHIGKACKLCSQRWHRWTRLVCCPPWRGLLR